LLHQKFGGSEQADPQLQFIPDPVLSFFFPTGFPFVPHQKKWFKNYEAHFGMVGRMLETANCMGSLVHIGTICLSHGISHAISMRAPYLAIRQG